MLASIAVGNAFLTEAALIVTVYRVTSCLENLEMSGNLEHVREKNLVMEKCPQTVHY